MDIKKLGLIIIPLTIFVLVVSVNFCKPFGFFRESNPAMIGINYTYWKQNSALREKRIPIESYNFDLTASPRTQMWSTVTSFGYGWFLAPYYFFTFFHIDADAITIRAFSLLWLTFTLLTIFLLSKNIFNGHKNVSLIVYLTLLFYVFNSSVLWYHVHGYVHEVAVLPFYFLNWLFFLKFIRTRERKWLTALSICLFVSVQFDWLPCFQAGVMSFYLLVSKNKGGTRLVFLLPAVGIAFGIAWIVYTYSSWATLPVYIEFLKEKFVSRTIGSGGLQVVPFLNYNFNIILFYATGFGLLCLIFIWGVFRKTQSTVLWLMILSGVIHHLVFWGFSTEHDHAVIKMSFPIAIVSASVVADLLPGKRKVFTCLLVLTNLLIYFYLHNFYVRPGMYTDPNFCYKVGTYIHRNIKDRDNVVFINTQGKYLLQIEFYAGRPYNRVSSLEEAEQVLHAHYPKKEGYFIDGERDGIKKVIKLR